MADVGVRLFFMFDKDGCIEHSTEQCQHPGEGTHIHVVEQVRPQGMKNNGQNNEIRHNNKNCRGKKIYPTIPCNNPKSDTGCKTQPSLSNRKNRRTPTSAII